MILFIMSRISHFDLYIEIYNEMQFLTSFSLLLSVTACDVDTAQQRGSIAVRGRCGDCGRLRVQRSPSKNHRKCQRHSRTFIACIARLQPTDGCFYGSPTTQGHTLLVMWPLNAKPDVITSTN